MVRTVFALLLLCLGSLSAASEALYLTLLDHPERHLAISWLSKEAVEGTVKFRKEGATDWKTAVPSSTVLDKLFGYHLERVELDGLEPATRYEFQLPEEAKQYTFTTLATTFNQPMRFVTGGDIYHDEIELVEEMNRVAAREDPHFALLGGDISYAGSKHYFFSESSERWLAFLNAWSKTMVRSNGDLIPMAVAIGNHDVNNGGFDESPAQAYLFYQLFLPAGRCYRTIDVGNDLSIFMLDSGHTVPVQGEQTDWLRGVLKEREGRRWKFAIYHVPAYPSVRAYSGIRSAKIRKHWVPLFEEYRLTTAFENHDHAYKRTHPILKGAVHPTGVMYLGDGSWGVKEPRTPRTPQQSWYIAKSKSVRQLLLVTLTEGMARYESIDNQGKRVDSFTR
ncbi:MAG: purple acid phosphatase family protein [Parachlamydiaceae bacterium]